MIKNFNSAKRREKRMLITICISLLVMFWLVSPPGFRFLNVFVFGNNTQLFIARLTNNYDSTAYKFHWNNAIYLSRMQKDKSAFVEIKKAINTIPSYVPEKEYKKLYRDAANIHLFFKDYGPALDYYLKSDVNSMQERLVLGLLYNVNGKHNLAAEACSELLLIQPPMYSGYACVAEVYASSGKHQTAVKLYDILIAQYPNKAQYYVERALYKKQMADMFGYNEDIAQAKSLQSDIKIENKFVESVLVPKELNLQLQK